MGWKLQSLVYLMDQSTSEGCASLRFTRPNNQQYFSSTWLPLAQSRWRKWFYDHLNQTAHSVPVLRQVSGLPNLINATMTFSCSWTPNLPDLEIIFPRKHTLAVQMQYMNHVYCLQPSSPIIMSQSVSIERTGACLNVMECIRQSEVSKYGRRQFKARSSGRFEALASKCSGFITVEMFFMPARGEWQMANLSLTIHLLMTLFLVHFIKLDKKGWNETAVSHIRCSG